MKKDSIYERLSSDAVAPDKYLLLYQAWIMAHLFLLVCSACSVSFTQTEDGYKEGLISDD